MLMIFLLISFAPIGDYVNSKEYRQPEWVTGMEAIKKRLDGNNFYIKDFYF